MPEIKKHAPGNFCWVELATTDQPAAESFYSKIFGWSADNIPIGQNEFYTIYQLEGRSTAAACTLRPEQPAWRSSALGRLRRREECGCIRQARCRTRRHCSRFAL